jgi:hypothetical protein
MYPYIKSAIIGISLVFLPLFMPSPRKATARMSTGGKPPGKSHVKDTISDEDNDDE